MIRSAARDGKIPWVSVDDVAMVAYRALVDEPSHDTEHLVLGPELLSYDDVRDSLRVLSLIRYHIYHGDANDANNNLRRLPKS
jgi:uncharacterized protein YbjT (DUF2867 family)